MVRSLDFTSKKKLEHVVKLEGWNHVCLGSKGGLLDFTSAKVTPWKDVRLGVILGDKTM